MPRPPRTHDIGGFHHVTSHGIDERPIFVDDFDRQSFLQRLGRVVNQCEWRVFAVCLMSTHFHLVVSFDLPTLSDGMQVVNGGHARHFNARHGRRGPVFERRYSDTHIEDERHLLACLRYVARNPLEAGLVDRPEDWLWSTYPQLIGLAQPWPFFYPANVLALFDARRQNAVKLIREYVEPEAVPGTLVSGTVRG